MFRSRVPGYREGLNVYQTFTCPRTDSAWTSASLRMNCNVGGDQPFNHYYCIPSAERTNLVEFCYDRASMKTEKGGMGYLNQVNCTNFVKGCPDYTYLSEHVYKIPACLDLNFSERCFTEEPGCTVLRNSTNALASNQTNAVTSLHLGLVALITCVLTVVILLLVVYWTKHKRPGLCSEINGKNENGSGKTTVSEEKGLLMLEEAEMPGENPVVQRDDHHTHSHTTNVDCEDQTRVAAAISPAVGPSDPKKNEVIERPDYTRSISVAVSDQDFKPTNVKGHISHLHWSKTGDIWASNDRGNVGLIDHSGNGKRLIKTCPTYSGHFALATIDNEEHIYWVHNEEKNIGTDSKDEPVAQTGDWEPISIFYSTNEQMFYVGKVMQNDAKITRYNNYMVKKNDIHYIRKHGKCGEKINFRYPAYLVTNINGDLCVSDYHECVIVVGNDKKIRFTYTGSGQRGFSPYGICTDSRGHILIVDSSSKCIHILTEEGTCNQTINISDNFRFPRGLCIDNNGHCFVGTYGSIVVYNYLSNDRSVTLGTAESDK